MPVLSLSLVLEVLALVHFAKKRPDTYWLWIIIIGGPVGSLAYLLIEGLPDLQFNQSFQWMHRRRRMKQLEIMVLDNPSSGNYEELGELYSESKQYQKARECFDKAITPRSDAPNPFYGRALCELELGDFAAACNDLEKVVAKDRKYDYQRALGLLAFAYAESGQTDRARMIFTEALASSTLSETQFHYALFLAKSGDTAAARQMAAQVLNKKATLPSYLKRRERPWFRRAQALLKQLPTGQSGAGAAQ